MSRRSARAAAPSHDASRPTAAVGDPATRADSLSAPDFWDWSELTIRPELELRQRLAAIRRQLRNAIEHPLELHREHGACSFELQFYARHQGGAALRSAQKGTVAGYIELWRRKSSQAMPRDALLALTVTLTDLGQREPAATMYRQLTELYPSSRELGLAHVRMADQAQKEGRDELAALRYADGLALLAETSRAYRHARARATLLATDGVGPGRDAAIQTAP